MASGTIETNYWLCTGCRICEAVCAQAKEGTACPGVSRIRIYQYPAGVFDIPVICRGCSDYPCISACPPGVRAISLDENTKRPVIDPAKCLGEKCGRCARACRHGSAITYHPETGKGIVCDLCQGNPRCVASCPTGALIYRPGSSFDGKHYARPPGETARSMGVHIKGVHPEGEGVD